MPDIGVSLAWDALDDCRSLRSLERARADLRHMFADRCSVASYVELMFSAGVGDDIRGKKSIDLRSQWLSRKMEKSLNAMNRCSLMRELFR